MFCCKACKLSKNNFFTEHLRMTASNLGTLQGTVYLVTDEIHEAVVDIYSNLTNANESHMVIVSQS